jgi:hypothetical protein
MSASAHRHPDRLLMMGGPGSGGARPNSGAKKKSPRERMLAGTATMEERELAIHPPPIKRVPRPVDLVGAASKVWDELAPLAEFERTLTNSTRAAFRYLCELIALRDEMLKEFTLEGLTVDTMLGPKAHPLIVRYQGMSQRVDAGMVRFRLAPFGKALFEEPKDTKKDGDAFDNLDTPDDDDDK